MLRKLMKHEFRATGRIMLPLLLILLVTAVGVNLSTRGLLFTEHEILELLGGLLAFAFIIAIAAVCIMCVALMILRFYRNLLRDEGYLMMTLPVSVHQQVWAKLLVSAVWFAATVLAVVLAMVIAAFDVQMIDTYFSVFSQVLDQAFAQYELDLAAYAAELIVLLLLANCAVCLRIYSALAIGHSFANHKLLWSVAVYFGISLVLEVLDSLLAMALGQTTVLERLEFSLSTEMALHAALAAGIAGALVWCIVFYFLTVFFLKNRLNLE